jgi:hypothetical protein
MHSLKSMDKRITLRPGLENWKATNPQHLEKWLGADAVNRVSKNMEEFYFPIALQGVPGNVYAMPGGDFCGKILTSGESCAVDRLGESLKAEKRRMNYRRAKASGQLGAFASADAVYAAMTGGKAQYVAYSKTGVASNAIGNANDLWTRAGSPAAGAAAASVPGGTVPTNASAGAMPFVNPASAGTAHFIMAETLASVINNTLLLYDRLFAAALNPNTTANQAVSGTPTRHSSTTPSSLSYAGGNFMFPANPTTVLAGTAHNWVAGGTANGGCTYTDQDGNTGANLPLIAGVSACVVGGVDLVANTPGWFMPLAAGDFGIDAITKIELSAAVATGTLDIVLAHPIAIMPHWAANLVCIRDGLRGAFNLAHIEDGACLSCLELQKPATTATNYNGLFTFCGE